MTVTVTGNAIRTLTEQVADTLLAIPTPPWNFGDSVGVEALLAASRTLGEDRWLRYAHGFVRSWADAGRPYLPLDVTAPGRAMVQLSEITGDRRVLEAAERLAVDHLAHRRRVAGVLNTWERSPLQQPAGPLALDTAEVPLLSDPGAGVFVDVLHFDPPFFATLGRVLGDAEWTERAVGEALAYVDLLQDEESGLFFHFHLERTGRRYALGWGRGQGWALLGLLDVIEEIADDHPQAGRLRTSVASLCAGMHQRQSPDGSWHAVAGVEQSGPEASTAAFMAAGFRRAVRHGILEPMPYLESADRALRAAVAGVDAHGQLRGVSAAVGACTADSHYWYVPRDFLVHWGQGPLVLALAEHEAGETS